MELRKFIKNLKLLDYLIILLFVLLLVIAYRFFFPERKWIILQVNAQNVSHFTANSFHRGDDENDPSGKKIAEIIDVDIFDSVSESKNFLTTKTILLQVKVLVEVNPRSGEYEYKNKIVKVGSQMQFYFTNGLFTGIVAETQRNQFPSQEKIITVKLYDQYPWFGESIQLESYEMITDSEEAISIMQKEIKLAEITTTNIQGETILTSDPKKVDITLVLKVKGKQTPGGFLFREYSRLLVGSTISFTAGKTRIENALITGIK